MMKRNFLISLIYILLILSITSTEKSTKSTKSTKPTKSTTIDEDDGLIKSGTKSISISKSTPKSIPKSISKSTPKSISKLTTTEKEEKEKDLTTKSKAKSVKSTKSIKTTTTIKPRSGLEDESKSRTESKSKLNTIEVSLLHFGNMKTIFDEVKLPKDEVGTLTHLHDFLEKERSAKRNVFLFNVGNSYVETFLHKALSFHILSQIMSLLKPDAITIGAKSFIGAYDEVKEFVKKSNYTFLSCNIDKNQDQDESLFLPYKIIPLNADKEFNLIVIGYTSTILNRLKLQIKANDPITSIKATLSKIYEEKKNLKNFKKIVIVMGWSNDETEKRIASEISDVDIIIGETSLSNEMIHYPVELRQKINTGYKNIYILKTSLAKTHYGLFKFIINKEGEIESFKGWLTNMFFHNGTSKKLSQILNVFKPVMDRYDGEIIARARVNFNPQCRRYECNLGNLITDAFVDYKASSYDGPYWTDTAIAVMNAGSIKEGINLDLKNGEISRGDILEVLPRKEFLVSLTITGANLYTVLEQGMQNWETEDEKGSFLQISGLHLICNKSMPSGSRVQFIRARCAQCSVPSYSPVDTEAEYRIITNEYLANGGDDYYLLKNGKNHVYEPITDVDAVMTYIQEHRVITTEVNDRMGSIVFLNGNVYNPNRFVIIILLIIIIICSF